MICPDSSVVIAAAAPWHAAHDAAVDALHDPDRPLLLIAHVAFETTAALSRMPRGQRVAPPIVLEWLERRFPAAWIALPADELRRTLQGAVASGVRGGALYDALIGATATFLGHQLLSADRRASPTYAVVGADVIFVDLD